MKQSLALLAALCGALSFLMSSFVAVAATPAASTPPKPSTKSFSEIVATATPADWRTLNPENTLYLDFASGRVIIELAPHMAPNHVANIKTLVREGYFDGLAFVRSQDNYVVQWGEPVDAQKREMKNGKRSLEAEYTVKTNPKFPFDAIPDRDGYAPESGFSLGFPAGRDMKAGEAWMTHCYGMVGAGRGNENNSGSGASLYTITSHAPRHLDRNITLVGRVVSGMPLLSVLPRGTGRLGFYEKPEQNAPIKSIRVAADVPASDRVTLEALRTDSRVFKEAVEALRNRGGDWFKVPAGFVEVCNVPQTVRVKANR